MYKIELNLNIPELERPMEGNYTLNQEILKYLFDHASIDRKFNEYVNTFLKYEAKINSKLIEQYYTANPPYMSVSGLLRYWDKKKE